MKKRLKILDIWVDPITRQEALEKVAAILRYGQRPHSIFAVNPEKNFSVPQDPEVYKVFEHADILLPDGIGIVWAARILFGIRLHRIPGAEFFEDICGVAAQGGYKIFIYGATEEVNRAAASVLQKRYNGLEIAGRTNGYLKPAGMTDLLQKINDSRAEILFLALGSPTQEKWFAAHQNSLENIKIVQGIGGTLDTITGKVLRAPQGWRNIHAEWLYRLIKEPQRLKRQKVLPIFMLRILKCKFFGPK